MEAEAWGKRLEEASGGRITVTYYWAESLAKMPELYDATAAGTCDIAQIDPSMTGERLAAWTIPDLPFVYGFPHVAGPTFVDLYNKYPEFAKQLAPCKLIWMQTPGPTNLTTTEVPVHTLEDLKGLKIFCVGPWECLGLKLLGATPVSMNPGERYTACERGILDGTSDDFNALYSWKVYEVTKYRTDNFNFITRNTPCIMNIESYEALPADLKAIFDKTTDMMEMTKRTNAAFEEDSVRTTNLIKEHDKTVGNPEFYILPDAERARWVEAVMPIRTEWVKTMTAKGLPAQAMLDDAIAFAAKY